MRTLFVVIVIMAGVCMAHDGVTYHDGLASKIAELQKSVKELQSQIAKLKAKCEHPLSHQRVDMEAEFGCFVVCNVCGHERYGPSRLTLITDKDKKGPSPYRETTKEEFEAWHRFVKEVEALERKRQGT